MCFHVFRVWFNEFLLGASQNNTSFFVVNKTLLTLRLMGSPVTGGLEIHKNPAEYRVKPLFFSEGPMSTQEFQ